MLIEKVFHMNSGNDGSSYANNSYVQESGLQRALPFLKEAVNKMVNDLDVLPRCLKIADLGCSPGPNTLLVVSNIIAIFHRACKEKNSQAPQFQVFLNDLFENDFNTLFKSLPTFYTKLNKNGYRCFVSGIPGSFYGRLFPNQSMHFFHSSYSVHWLSRVPQGLENNKLNIYMAKGSPPNVFEAYRLQFEKDFINFLQLRSQEIIRGGGMVLAIAGRSIVDPTSDDCCTLWELLAKSLVDMAKEGLVRESDINSFNMPYYTPCEVEVRDAIKKEGSFILQSLNSFSLNWEQYNNTDVSDGYVHGMNTTKFIRAIMEPIMATHFGNSVMDMVFNKCKKYVVDHLATKKGVHFILVISLTKH